MPEETGGGSETVTAPAFADYVHDITGQLARTAGKFDMPELESALHDACEAAIAERDRYADGHG